VKNVGLVWVLVFASLALAAPFVRATETLDRIIVVVNDEIVTEQDLRSAAEPILAQYRATMSASEYEEKSGDVRKRVLDSLIEDRLIRSVAKREKVEVDEIEVDQMMEDVQKKFPSKEIFERVMREQGMSFTKLRDRFRDQILNRRMIDLKVRSEVLLSPGEVREYYDANSAQFQSPASAHVRQILLRAGEQRSIAEAKELANSIIAEINKGIPMEDLAKKYSDSSEAAQGGDMGWIEKGQFVEHIDEQIFRLDVGQRTDPIESQIGVHIFQVIEKKAAEQRTFADARLRVEAIIYRKKTAEQLKKWLTELRKNAYIAYQS